MMKKGLKEIWALVKCAILVAFGHTEAFYESIDKELLISQG